MEYNLDINVNGEKADQEIKSVVANLNAAQAATQRNAEVASRLKSARSELFKLAKAEREEAFAQLPLEDRINKLMERREALARRVASARTEERKTLLTLAARRNDAELRDAQKEKDGTGLAARAKDFVNQIPGGSFVSGLVSKVGVAGAGAAAAALGLKAAAQYAAGLNDLSQRTEISVAALQKLGFAAKATGGSFDGAIRTVETLRKAQSEALAGSTDMAKAFERLGVSAKQMEAFSPDELFYAIAAAVKDGAINAANFSSFLKVAGEDAKALIPAMKQGLADAAKEMGGLAASAGALRSLNTLWEGMERGAAKAAAAIKKVGIELAGGFLSAAKLVGGIGAAAFGATDTAANLLASRELQNDADYQASLDQSDAMQKKLDQKKAVKSAKAEQEAATAKEVKEETLKPEAAVGKPERAPVDSLARVGLFRGGAAEEARGREQLQRLTGIETKIGRIQAAVEAWRL